MMFGFATKTNGQPSMKAFSSCASAAALCIISGIVIAMPVFVILLAVIIIIIRLIRTTADKYTKQLTAV